MANPLRKPLLTAIALYVTLLVGALGTSSVCAQGGAGGRVSPQMIFDRLDSNGDGQLTRRELAGRERLLSAFDYLDGDGDGVISYEEMSAISGRGRGARNGGGGSSGGGRGQRSAPPPAETAVASAVDPTTAKPVALPGERYGTARRTIQVGKGRDAVDLKLTFPLGEGPFPLILFSPYLAGSDEAYRPHHDFLAGQGYVVAELQHEDSVGRLSDGNRDALSNWRERPEDFAYVLDNLQDIGRRERRLDGKLDLEAVGVSGHLIGAMGASLMVGAVPTSGERYADPRVAAALLMAPQGRGGLMDENSWQDIDRPMMVITGTELPSRRTGNPASWRTEPFRFAQPPDKYLVYVNGMDGRFGGLFDEGGSSNGRFSGVVNAGLESYVLRSELWFWDAHLRGDAEALTALASEQVERDSAGIADASTQPGSRVGDAPRVAGGAGGDYVPASGILPVRHERLTLTDRERRRDVPVTVYAPSASPLGDGWPVVVFSHGLGESRDSYGYLGDALASNGYAVIFMNHEGSDAAVARNNFRGLNTVDNAQQKAADTHFVIDQVVADAIESELLRGRMDADRLVAAGQCAGSSIASAMGGLTAKLPGNERFSSRDDRVDAIMLLGPQVPLGLAQPSRAGNGKGTDMLQPDSWSGIDLPLLVVASERDFLWYDGVKRNPDVRITAYTTAVSDEKYLVDLAGGGHHAFTDSTPWYPAGPRNPQHHAQIEQSVMAFLDAYVGGNQDALAWLQAERLESAGVRQEHVTTRGPTVAVAAAQAPTPLPAVERDAPAPTAAPWNGSDYYKLAPGPYAFDVVRRVDLDDRARNKQLQVRVTYPRAAPAPRPLIVFAHGAWASNENYQPLVEHWASHGYVVLQANHRDSAALGTTQRDTSVFRDWRDRPEDVHLMLDSLDAIEGAAPALKGLIDRSRIGVGGHSYGAHTAQLVAGTKILDVRTQRPVNLGDERVDAALLMSPQGRGQLLDERAWDTLQVPMMVMTGSNDPGRGGDGVSWRIDPFVYAGTDQKHLLFIDGAYHDFGGATGGTMSGSRAHPDADIVRYTLSASIAFWDAYLLDSAEALGYLESGAMEQASRGRVTLTQSRADGERIASQHNTRPGRGRGRTRP
ncbi:MAG: hypothetical protein AAF184_03100 [Pseudomonadota bacterium]